MGVEDSENHRGASARIYHVCCRKMGRKKKKKKNCSSFKENSYKPESGDEGAPQESVERRRITASVTRGSSSRLRSPHGDL